MYINSRNRELFLFSHNFLGFYHMRQQEGTQMNQFYLEICSQIDGRGRHFDLTAVIPF